MMQFTRTIFPDSTIFIEKKRVENRLWRKSTFCGEKVKNAGEKKMHHIRPSAGTRVPSPGCPASPATGRLHYQPGPRPGRAPSTAPPGPPEADPDPGPRLRHRGLRAPAHKSGSERRSAVEAIGRFINQSPGCRQGTILAPVAAWQPLPGSGAVSALGHFGTKTRPRGRARHVTSDATGT